MVGPRRKHVPSQKEKSGIRMPTLNWIDKEALVKHHQEAPFRLLEPVRREGSSFKQTPYVLGCKDV